MQNITPFHCFYVVFYILEFFSPIDRKKIIKKTKHLTTRSSASHAVSALPRVLVLHPSGVSDTVDAALPSFLTTANIMSYMNMISIFLLNGLTVTLIATQKRHLMT